MPNTETSTIDKEQFNKYPCNGCPEKSTDTYPKLPLKTDSIVPYNKDHPALNKVKITEADAIEIELHTRE